MVTTMNNMDGHDGSSRVMEPRHSSSQHRYVYKLDIELGTRAAADVN
jgi:hypothetical protein